MIVINREINDTLILRTKQEEEKKETRILFDNEKSYDKAYSIFDEFIVFFFFFCSIIF